MGGNLTAEISIASKDFFNFFRFDKGYFDSYSIGSLLADMLFKRGADIRDFSKRLVTIKVRGISETSIENAAIKSTRIIEASLFKVSYLKNLAFWLVDEWPSSKRSKAGNNRIKSLGEPYPSWAFQLRADYNSDLIKFYQFGMSTGLAEMKFLSFYQVLEYFFIQISNEKLYEKLSTKIKDPKFTLSETNLDRIVFDVVKHKNENDETEMLKNVLKKFVDEQEIIEFIKNHEKYLGKPVYSGQHSVFGASMEIRLQIGQTISNISKEIKEIRNALVHSTDRYERNARHVPFTKSTELIEERLPLMKFLAEKVIVNSGTPYT
jgi:hypothetical protein